ncbi:TonB-dependent receptor domain-containing protein [Pedobacter metabolipauper]|uniref:Outer membrane receptor protein involved in Fe transport n=1 Tax=Pedobacter metabolipauper TaxID=425513 RepID=A0A4R6T0X5_9SPHI|nr:TonB-dependent receptor [Pedobacter metabolipauper]TDQ10991.1 outer membrane receptor protein involved in Fe transport [Pedobacter metabolipauper]
MKKHFLLVALLLINITAFAQHMQLRGTVKEGSPQQPIPYVTVTISDTSSKLVAAAITDDKGVFKFEKIPAGKFLVSFSFTGFQTVNKTVQIGTDEVLNLGDVIMQPDPRLLNEVSVTAERKAVSLNLDKKVFEVGKDMLSQTGSVTDLLNIVPSVSVSATGGISLRGNSNVLVLIDGRRTGLTQSNALEQLPADQVERVEIITNPSSRYDAAGSAGIINIILKKNKKAGFNGQVRLVGGIPNDTRISPSLNYKSNKLNLFSTISLRLSDYVGLYTMQQTTGLLSTPTYLNRRQDENRHDDSRLLYFGADYQLDSRNSLTAAYLRNATYDHDKTRLNYGYSGNNGDLDSSLNRTGESWENRSYNQMEFNYTRTFIRPGKKFSVDMQYDFWDSDKDWNLNTSRLYPAAITLPMIRTGSAGISKDLMIQTDLLQPLDSNSTLEFGLKMESRRVSSDFIAQQQNGSTWDVIEQIDNHLLYKELIGSAYTQFAGKTGKFSYQAGLRSEFTHIGIDDRIGTYTNKKNYNRLFPTLNLSYGFGTVSTIQGSFSKRINRPPLHLIYPFNELTDLTTRFLGNPDLNPSYADVFELSFLKNWPSLTFNPSVYYQHNSGEIEEYTSRNSDGLFVTTPVNIGSEVRRGLELSLLYNPVNWLQVNTELNAYSFSQHGSYLAQNVDFKGHSFTTRISAQIKLPNKLGFQALYNFRGANGTAQTRSAAVHNIDFAASKNLLKDKATLTFDVANLLDLRKFNDITTTENYRIHQTSMPNAARYRLTLVYRVNLKDNQAVRQAKSGNRN